MHEESSLDELPVFRHTVDSGRYYIDEDNAFTKNHYSIYFILPIAPTLIGPLID